MVRWYIRTATATGGTAYDTQESAVRQARSTLKLQEQRGSEPMSPKKTAHAAPCDRSSCIQCSGAIGGCEFALMQSMPALSDNLFIRQPSPEIACNVYGELHGGTNHQYRKLATWYSER
jgi:hypothetical protein